MDLHDLLTKCARSQGIHLSGSVDLRLALADPRFQQHVEKYDHWLAAGYAGQMQYLHRGRNRRADPREVFPETQSIFCVAFPYSSEDPFHPSRAPQTKGRGFPLLDDAPKGPRYARYLRGEDYHEKLPRLLNSVLTQAATIWNPLHPDQPLKWKVCVDSSAVLERTWASLAGLGWIGKNTLLIHPKYGSFIYLAEVLLNQETGRAPAPLPNYCGNCTRCMKACPTQAIPTPHTLDANQCISYWTLEKRGLLEISDEKKSKMGDWIAGCDLCQEACPFNWRGMKDPQAQLATQTHTDLLTESVKTQEPSAIDLNGWLDLLKETPTEYRARVKNSSLSRVKDYQFSRNLAISLRNALPQMSTQAKNELEPWVRRRAAQETHEAAQPEWLGCLSLYDCPILSP